MKLCTICGEPSEGSRCPAHQRKKASATARGYDGKWAKLSAQARKLQPWCSACGSTDNLSVDHSPEAWKLANQGKTLTLTHFRDSLLQVLCIRCNIAKGKARSVTGQTIERTT